MAGLENGASLPFHHSSPLQARRQAFVWGGAFQSKMDSGDLSCNKIWMTGFACHALVSIFMPFCHHFAALEVKWIDTPE